MRTWIYAVVATIGGLYGYLSTRDPLGVVAGAVAGVVAFVAVSRFRRAILR